MLFNGISTKLMKTEFTMEMESLDGLSFSDVSMAYFDDQFLPQENTDTKAWFQHIRKETLSSVEQIDPLW